MRHVVFFLEKDRYALPLASIREVVVTPSLFSLVPRAPEVVKGIINLRGRVVTVVDLKRLLAMPSNGLGKKVVLLDRGRQELGLLVTEVEGIESIEKVGPAAKVSPAVRGVARLGALAITVLDPDGLDSVVARAFVRG